MAIDLGLRCFNCNMHAYCDAFEGEYGASGYVCLGCIRRLNEELQEEIKHRFFEEQGFLKKKEMDESEG